MYFFLFSRPWASQQGLNGRTNVQRPSKRSRHTSLILFCLSKPTTLDILVLYLATIDHAVSAALVREHRPVYFISCAPRCWDEIYPNWEGSLRSCGSRKETKALLSISMKVYTGVPLKKAFANFDSSGRLLAWALELSKFDVSFHPQNNLKLQIFADFIAKYLGGPLES